MTSVGYAVATVIFAVIVLVVLDGLWSGWLYVVPITAYVGGLILGGIVAALGIAALNGRGDGPRSG